MFGFMSKMAPKTKDLDLYVFLSIKYAFFMFFFVLLEGWQQGNKITGWISYETPWRGKFFRKKEKNCEAKEFEKFVLFLELCHVWDSWKNNFVSDWCVPAHILSPKQARSRFPSRVITNKIKWKFKQAHSWKARFIYFWSILDVLKVFEFMFTKFG